MIVLLEDKSTGEINENVSVGEEVTVTLHDENGNEIEKTGIIEEILID